MQNKNRFQPVQRTPYGAGGGLSVERTKRTAAAHPAPAAQAGRTHRRGRLLTALLAVMLCAGGLGARALGHASTAARISSGISGLCLDDRHNSSAAGNAVTTWNCNGSDAQTWIVASGLIKHNDECLSTENNAPDNQSKVVLNPCSGASGQRWQAAAGGFENPPSALCLLAAGTKPGAQLELASCGNLTTASERWTAGAPDPAAPTPSAKAAQPASAWRALLPAPGKIGGPVPAATRRCSPHTPTATPTKNGAPIS